MYRKALFLLAVAGLTCAAPLYAQEPVKSPKEATIRKVLTLMGTNRTALQVMDQMIEQFKVSQPSVPEEVWARISEKIHRRSSGLIDLVVPLYDKYYTQEDLDQMVAFYESPVGKKMLEVTPKLTQESMAAGAQWGRQLVEELAREIESERPAQKPAPKPAPKPAAKPTKKKS